MTFYNEYEEPRSDRHRRRNQRRIIGAIAVVGLMVVAAVVGAIAASGSHSHDGAAAAPTTSRGAAKKPPAPKHTKATAKTKASSAAGSSKSGSGSQNPAENALTQHLPPGQTLPKTITTVTAAPASPAVISAYVTAFRQECQAVWSHADADGLLWDPDDPGSDPHRISECYEAMDPIDESLYDTVTDAQQYARDNVDSAVEDMTLAYRFRSTKGVVFDVP